MSENRFKVSKADTDGTKEIKETYRRVNLSTDIQVNIIEPSCKCAALYTILYGILKMDRDTCGKNIPHSLSHISCYLLCPSRGGLYFFYSL